MINRLWEPNPSPPLCRIFRSQKFGEKVLFKGFWIWTEKQDRPLSTRLVVVMTDKNLGLSRGIRKRHSMEWVPGHQAGVSDTLALEPSSRK